MGEVKEDITPEQAIVERAKRFALEAWPLDQYPSAGDPFTPETMTYRDYNMFRRATFNDYVKIATIERQHALNENKS